MTTIFTKLVVITSTILLLSTAGKAQIARTIAGNGTRGNSGNNGAAISASLYAPCGITVDRSGNLYTADYLDNVIRKVDPSGMITLYAGNGEIGLSGDGGPATLAAFNYPLGLTTDAAGNIYVADDGNDVIRKIDASGNISSVAGNGHWGYCGDGGPATAARLNGACAVAIDRHGNMFIADGNTRVRKVDTHGTITTLAGSGGWGYGGDGGPAASAYLAGPTGVAVDSTGNVYIADELNNVIRMVDTNGIITTFAGNHHGGFSGDGGLATAAKLSNPYNVAVDDSGNVIIADMGNNRIRKVNAAGIISTIFGTGTAGYTGNGGPAVHATVRSPNNICLDNYGTIFISDYGNHVIRELFQSAAINMTTFPGNAICSATPVNFNAYLPGGTYGLSHQWTLNHTTINIDSLSYATDSIHNGDQVIFTVSDTAGGFTLYADTVTMTVSAVLVPSVTITNNTTGIICSGSPAYFSGTFSAGGAHPEIAWYVNGIAADSGASFHYIPADSDVVTCRLTSSFICASPAIANSNPVVVPVHANLPVSVAINPSANGICQGGNVTFTPAPVNGGSTPVYYWQKYGVTIDSGNSYTYIPETGDGISCRMQSSATCPVPFTAASNIVTMIVNPEVSPVASIMAFPADTVTYLGQTITLYAEVTNGGTAPAYQWYRNHEVISGATNLSYNYNVYGNDTLYCIVTGNAPCTANATDTSNAVVIYAAYLGISDLNIGSNDGIQLFPNPNAGVFELNTTLEGNNSGPVKLEVLNVTGAKVYEAELTINNNAVSGKIDLTGMLVPGTYFLRMTGEKDTKNVKFIINK